MISPVVAMSAGRFDADPMAVVARLHRAAKTQSVFLSTEVMPKQWRVIRKHLPAGWKAVHTNEYLIAWDDRAMGPKGAKAHWTFISRGFFNRGHIKIRAKSAGLRLAWRKVADDPGCYYDVAHLPAHLQQGDDYTKDPKFRDEVAAHKQAVNHLGRRAARRAAKYPQRRQCLGMDVNVDLFRPHWRTYMRRGLTMTGVWGHDTLPDQGDMGRRLITGVWTRGFGTTDGEVTHTPTAEFGLDHKMVDVWSKAAHTP